MSDVFSYDEAVAEQAEQDVLATANQLEAQLNELQAHVNQTKANWDGDEKEQYAAIQAQWDSSADKVREAINGVRQVLGTNTEFVKQMRGRVRGQLGG